MFMNQIEPIKDSMNKTYKMCMIFLQIFYFLVSMITFLMWNLLDLGFNCIQVCLDGVNRFKG
jgi:hypothetical protein